MHDFGEVFIGEKREDFIMSALISIIIPVYNSEKYLEACLESVLAQTYKNLEVIIVNDGSTDRSLEICNRFALEDKRITIINKKNSGVSAARNDALAIAQGKFLSFCDSDDMMHASFIESMLALIEKHNADFACCSYSRSTIKDLNIDKHQEQVLSEKNEMMEAIIDNKDYGGYLWNKLFKKCLFDKLMFDEHIRICEDELICVQFAALSNKMVLSNDCLYYYRDNTSGALHQKFNENVLTYVIAKDKIIEVLEKNNYDIHMLERQYEKVAYLYSSYYLKLIWEHLPNCERWEKILEAGIKKYNNQKICQMNKVKERLIILLTRFIVLCKND